ncbi:MAG TPA: glycosyltransferase [Chitinispirillaceae bacterium]|nr:glycosyltransferase [Chitinispirillaceae bacterium]
MIIILTVLLFLYAIFLVYLIFSITKKSGKIPQANTHVYPVSIVIPFRNETSNIPGLIKSLKKQSYKGPVELVLINDNSTDNSVETARSSTENAPFDTRILHLKFEQSRKLTSKQQAVDLGIRSAKNELIILSDADMVFDTDWINLLVKNATASPETALVFGHTSIAPVQTVFDLIQAFQLEFLFSAAYAFHRGKITGSCMGNNIILSREAYLKLGGFDAIGYSIVEDRALFAAFAKKKMRIAFTDPFFPSAHTPAAPSVNMFFHQMLRWSRGGVTLNSNLILPSMLLLVQTISSLCIFSVLPLFPSLIAAGNIVLTITFLWITFYKTHSRITPWVFSLWIPFLLVEIAIFVYATIFKTKIAWKGRNI